MMGIGRRPFLIGISALAAIVICGSAALNYLQGNGDRDVVNRGGYGLAIRGYDPVAYFTISRPLRGSPDITYRWSDATWTFANAEHRDMFAGDPEKYAPRYGGFCAMGIADGFVANIDPEAWTIVEGRLYLNRNAALMKRWRQDPSGNIAKADARWSGDRGELKDVWSEGR